MNHPIYPELRSALITRAVADQRARCALDPYEPTVAQWQCVHAIDEDNTRFLTQIISVHGWPGHRMVGVDGAHSAWLLAQHAPAPYRAIWLPKLRAAVHAKDASPCELAHLEDRVNIDHRHPQRYGTQWCRTGTTRQLFPLADPSAVNTLRDQARLRPLRTTDIQRAMTSYPGTTP